jgi:Flp pilus assembly pilin Flp
MKATTPQRAASRLSLRSRLEIKRSYPLCRDHWSPKHSFIRESVACNSRGQTMTEYALILAAIAVVVYGVYAAMGNNIGTLASGIDSL